MITLSAARVLGMCKVHEALHREEDEAMVMGEEASEESVWDCVGLPGSQIA